MSLLKNDFKEKLSFVILCAGEGKRLEELTKDIPKPLLKIEALDYDSILQNTIVKLINLGVGRIGVVIGHLGNKIKDFIFKIRESDKFLQHKLYIINSGIQYKLGSLYSFLSIKNDQKFFIPESIYILIPGDTIFEFKLLKEIISIISENITVIKDNGFIFYRKIDKKVLKEDMPNYKLISFGEVKKFGLYNLLKRIYQGNLQSILTSSKIMQIIPSFGLDYNFFNIILDLKENLPFRTIWEMINYLILKEKKIYAFEIESNYKFHDIDSLDDLTNLNKKKEDNRRSD
ncbi:MAG: hypothetical protein JSV23_05045 [Promethearchaeota archaeon]|nr:MAG: hypothetical protein JSV23_05045 [Candidatus Lokiarchaeota archaeon]